MLTIFKDAIAQGMPLRATKQKALEEIKIVLGEAARQINQYRGLTPGISFLLRASGEANQHWISIKRGESEFDIALLTASSKGYPFVLEGWGYDKRLKKLPVSSGKKFIALFADLLKTAVQWEYVTEMLI